MLEELLKIVPFESRQLVTQYWQFWQSGSKHFCRRYADKKLKPEKLRLLEKAMRRGYMLPHSLLAKLQKSFIQENISPSILFDLLTVWRYWADDQFPISEQQYSDMCGHIAAPFSRLLMALNNENPSTYLPMAALLSEMFYTKPEIITPKITINIKTTSKKFNNKCSGWLKNATVLLEIVSTWHLKMQVAVLLNHRKLHLKYIATNKQPAKSLLDEIIIFLYSFYQCMIIRKKTLQNKGI